MHHALLVWIRGVLGLVLAVGLLIASLLIGGTEELVLEARSITARRLFVLLIYLSRLFLLLAALGALATRVALGDVLREAEALEVHLSLVLGSRGRPVRVLLALGL